jgi:hypothetical protein
MGKFYQINLNRSMNRVISLFSSLIHSTTDGFIRAFWPLSTLIKPLFPTQVFKTITVAGFFERLETLIGYCAAAEDSDLFSNTFVFP